MKNSLVWKMKADKALIVLIIATALLSSTIVKAKALSRPKRQAEYDDTDPAKEPDGSGEGQAAEGEAAAEGEKKGGGVSLGKILGLAFLACCIIYCIGISWKVYKVCKGTYVEEEPVFLKYKWTTTHILKHASTNALLKRVLSFWLKKIAWQTYDKASNIDITHKNAAVLIVTIKNYDSFTISFLNSHTSSW